MKELNEYSDIKKRHKRNHRITLLFTGCLLLFSGIILYLSNCKFISEEHLNLIFSWQSLLFVIAIFILIISKFRFWFFPTILIIVSGVFFIEEFNNGIVVENFPSISLIVVGLLIILRIIIPSKKGFCAKCKSKDNFSQDCSAIYDEFIKREINFSKINYICESKNFKGGNIKLNFSGGDIDFRNTELAAGINVLKIECVFSGIKIFVPQNWDISFESSGVFGGMNDNRHLLVYDKIDKDKKLIIKCEFVFSGGEIFN